MERKHYFFHYKQASLHYSVYGNGNKPLFLFHGFGLRGEVFYELEKVLAKEYTLYNFDLFFHGKSEWKAGEAPMTEAFWKDLVTQFIKEKNISSFSLLGYSIGAKLVWSTVKNISDKVKEIIVIAPDGITSNTWYTLATRTALDRAIFKAILFNEKIITALIKTGRWLRLVPSITIRFAESQLGTEEQRKRVYQTWLLFRKLRGDNKKLAFEINNNKIDLTIYLGAHDKIITYEIVLPLVEKVIMKNVIILPAGHSNLIQAVKNHLNK
jgi:pimeloyl-ACP methyl ester carboxylesterase